jgi:hexosaminidase
VVALAGVAMFGLVAMLGLISGCEGDRGRPAALAGAGAPRGPEASASSRADAGATPERPAPPAQMLALLPRPASATTCAGALRLDATTAIVIDTAPEVRAIGERLAGWLGLPLGRVRAIAAGEPGPARAIVLRLDAVAGQGSERDPAVEPPTARDDEAYTLEVSAERAVVRARHPAGLFYGAQTLAQLAGSRPIAGGVGGVGATSSGTHLVPCGRIEDAPAYRVRAMHLDVARHFFSKEVVERFVDLLAFYRINVFHWHLTDDQGFRLAIGSHPELTQIGGHRVEDGHDYGGSYSQEDAREVVAWAKERFITVVPEIEMPGHARAILAAHPELSCTGKKLEVPSTWGVFEDVLCAGNERTFALLDDVLAETCSVFPSRLVHVGGDEVPKARWSACPKCRARMAKEHLDAEQLQGAFMKRVGATLAARGRRVLAWDEALEGGLPKDGAVVAWQGAARGARAALLGHDVVMAPHDTAYFNYWQTRGTSAAAHAALAAPSAQVGHEGYLPWMKVLAFDPMPPGLDARAAAHVLGGEGALWTEYVRTGEELEAMLLPRLAALAEALWRAPAASGERAAGAEEASFAARFRVQRAMLDASDVRYFVEPPTGLLARRVFLDTVSVALGAPALHPDGVVRFTLDGSDPSESSTPFVAPLVLGATTSIAARLFLPGGRASGVVRGKVERSTLRAPIQPSTDPATLREGVVYKYFEGDFRRLPDFTTLAARRGGRLPALGFDPAFRAERFAVVYEAWVLAPQDGVYRFVARADDGVAVDVDSERVIEDDGVHAAREAEGEIALARGPHTVRVAYFQGGGGKALSLACEGPGLLLGPCRLVSP